MPWQEKSIMDQKEEFIKRAMDQREPFSNICEEFGISRTLGYDLLRRYKAEGREGLLPRNKAPIRQPNKTPEHIKEVILNTREDHPTWGARKIKSYLLNKKIGHLPAASTISDILKRHGYISMEASLKRKELIRFEREQPNDLWQMDFKGYFRLGDHNVCYPLTVIDDHSRFSLCIKACTDEACLPVKRQLINTFAAYGLPSQINVDNGRPWGNSCLVRYTELTVWLMQLNVLVTHSRPRHPQTNGKNERFNRTLKEDVIANHQIDNLKHAQKLFDQWRHVYNYVRPHEAIGMLVPADRYKPSVRQLPSKLPAIEYESRAILRKVSNSFVSFKKNKYLVGKAFIGHHVELKYCEARQLLDIYFGQHKIYSYEL
jgi:transposase InsO family protein